MSRFYDALKRAGQPPPLMEEGGDSEAFPSLEEHPTQVQEILSEVGGDDASPRHPDLPLAQEPIAVTSKEEIGEFSVGCENGDCGTSVQIAFHSRARLIPNILDTAVIEQYRLLRTKLLQQKQEKIFKSLLITSPGPREGKTVTTLNLALTFGLLPDFKVLVVEGDLRKGVLGELLRVGPRPGLSELIEGSAKLQEAVLKPEEVPVSFIVRGNSCHAPGELLHSPCLPTLMHTLTGAFDLILIDSPPVNFVTDAHLLASYCDGVLLVARAFATSCKDMEEASQALLPYRVIGTILNGYTKLSPYSRYRSYY